MNAVKDDVKAPHLAQRRAAALLLDLRIAIPHGRAQATTTARTFHMLQRGVLQALVDLLALATMNRRIMTLSTTLDSSAN